MPHVIRLRRPTFPESVKPGSSMTDIIAALDANPTVEEYSVTRKKSTGAHVIRAVSRNGKVITHEQHGPGLTSTMISALSGNTPAEQREARHDNICALSRNGLTQVDIANRLGCSQSLVSKVLRERGEI